MPMQISRWQRYPDADRNALAGAALRFCPSHRVLEGVRTRFYWVTANEIVVLSEAESAAALNAIQPGDEPRAEIAQAAFDLSDVAWMTQTFRAGEPGAKASEAAGRVTALPR